MQIADSLVQTSDYKLIIEVGPGQGMLTKHLLRKDNELIVVEADRDMVSYLQHNYPELKNQIAPADFLKMDLAQLSSNRSFGLIGNYPYNISSQILFKMLDYKELIPEMVGMFQKEVAKRVIAGPGSKTYGVISVLIQAYYSGEYLFTVGPEEFNPPPKVQSGVIRLTRKANQELGCSYALFRQIVKQSFSQRRKMLRNTMKQFLKDDAVLGSELFRRRPEELSVEEFVELTLLIDKRSHGN